MKKYSLRPFFTTLREILIPNASQVILFLIASAALLLIIFADHLMSFFIEDNETKSYLKQNISDFIANIDYLPFSEYISSIFVWGIIGVISYVIIVTVMDIIIMVINRYILEKQNHSFVRFDSFSRFDEYRRVVWIFSFAIFLSLSLTRLLLIWLNIFEFGVINLSLPHVLISLGCLAYNAYLVYMLAWVSLRNPHIFVPR
ncbi:MAG: hypothetical protein AAB423_03070 [Patescibacteria group bacterium]|mgnify:CR=1 FL=1